MRRPASRTRRGPGGEPISGRRAGSAARSGRRREPRRVAAPWPPRRGQRRCPTRQPAAPPSRARLLRRQVLARADSARYPPRAAREAQVDHLGHSRVRDHVRGLQIEVQVAASVEVVHRRAEVEAEDRDVAERRPASRTREALDGLALDRLEYQDRSGGGYQLIAADDVGVGEPAEEPALRDKPRPWTVLPRAVGTDQLRHAQALPLLAPDVVDVERPAPCEVRDDLVAGSRLRAGGERRRTRARAGGGGGRCRTPAHASAGGERSRTAATTGSAAGPWCSR